MTSKMLLEQYMAERHALGFSLKTDEGCIRRFLQDFAEPDDGEISFTKEYVLDHIPEICRYGTGNCLWDAYQNLASYFSPYESHAYGTGQC